MDRYTFCTSEEVRGFLSGRRTRLSWPIILRNGQPAGDDNIPAHEPGGPRAPYVMDFSRSFPQWEQLDCPYGVPGDRLKVHETLVSVTPGRLGILVDSVDPQAGGPARIVIEVAIVLEATDVRVLRVQETTEEEALAEGVEGPGPGIVLPGPFDQGRGGQPGFSAYDVGAFPTAREAYRFAWDVRWQGRYPYSSNPWAWGLAVKVVSRHFGGVHEQRGPKHRG